MTLVTATMRTLDLREATHTPVTGRHVWKLQAMLNIWLRSADTPADQEPSPLLATDGIGGPATQQVLSAFQEVHELKPDAIVGPRTWQMLLEFDVLGG